MKANDFVLVNGIVSNRKFTNTLARIIEVHSIRVRVENDKGYFGRGAYLEIYPDNNVFQGMALECVNHQFRWDVPISYCAVPIQEKLE